MFEVDVQTLAAKYCRETPPFFGVISLCLGGFKPCFVGLEQWSSLAF